MNASEPKPKKPTFSVVIPVKDCAPFLEEVVEALQALEVPPGGFEVLFVDDRSRDGSYELLEQLTRGDLRFRLVRGPGRGPEGARNAGLREARGRYVAFTDADTIPEPGWLVTAAAALRRHRARALEGVVAPWPGEEPKSLVRMPVNADGGRYMTANMVYERALLADVGGFDEKFNLVLGLPHFLEDTDLAFRVMDAGVEIPFVPEMRVRHRRLPMQPRSWLRDQAKVHWMPLVARRYPSRYAAQLRPKVQALRPGDVDFLLALPLFLLTVRRNPLASVLAGAALAIATRRVLSGVDLGRVAPEERPAWYGAALAAPVVRVGALAWGWLRFRKVAV